jgi:RNA polymerase sigma-70 factor (ECF subfamily)
MDQVPTRTAPPDARAQEAELAERFKAALADLPAGQREVFCLRHLNEMSYEEIARETNSTVEAVGVALHRARARLRAALLPPDPDAGNAAAADTAKRSPAAAAATPIVR